MPIFKEQSTLMPPLGLVIPEEHLRRLGEYYIGMKFVPLAATPCARGDCQHSTATF
jgi:hypothetical protein